MRFFYFWKVRLNNQRFMVNTSQKRKASCMFKLGIEIIPVMPVEEIIAIAVEAERLGYSYCIMADEGFMPDVYVCLGAIAQKTSSLMIGPVTNGYSRHPAVTAAAVATLNSLSGGRALATLVAGGSYVLRPMKIPREKPLAVVRDTIEIMRCLWTGESVSYEGARYHLDSAQLTFPSGDIPIWVAGRGDKMLNLTGELADGAMLMVKPDLKLAFELVEAGSAKSGHQPQRIFLDRIAYTPELISETADFFPYVIADTPTRQLKGFLAEDDLALIQNALANGGPAAAAELITTGMIKNYKIAGTPEECSQELANLIQEHQLDVFILNLTSSGLEKNIRMMEDVRAIADKALQLSSAN
jgi:5,10-methylenetetrahydromethanopterin reductase